MLYFNPKPNFQQLSKYYTIPLSKEHQEYYQAHGYDIVINWYDTDEAVENISEGFMSITDKYDLSTHYDNLFYLSLVKIQENEGILDELYFQHGQKKRTKELANLLLGLSITPRKELSSILLKTLKETYKIADSKLMQALSAIIIDGVKQGNLPAGDFEFNIREMFFDNVDGVKQLNIEKLKVASNMIIESPKRREKAMQADFCFFLYAYLVNETDIKADKAVLLSDKQLNFYFDLLALFGYIEVEKIESEEKDYMGTLLKNRIKTLNPHYQGNKEK